MAPTQHHQFARERMKAAWMLKFETKVLELMPQLAGKIDWNTALHMMNINYSADFAAKEYCRKNDSRHC